MNCFAKNKKGFTLIEIIVVVIILAILAAIAVPIYFKYVAQARSSEAQSALSSLRTAYQIQKQTYGTYSNYTVEQAMSDANLGEATIKNWEFEVIGNPPKKYIATSTSEFPSGEGLQVVYDVKDAQFSGWGIDEFGDEEEEDFE